MSYLIKGNFIGIVVHAGKTEHIILPDGYSIGKIISYGGNINLINENEGIIVNNVEYTFPVVNGKSPCQIYVNNGGSATVYRWVCITEFGGEPDLHYFDSTFKPILVKRKDGTEYNLIPTRNKGGV